MNTMICNTVGCVAPIVRDGYCLAHQRRPSLAATQAALEAHQHRLEGMLLDIEGSLMLARGLVDEIHALLTALQEARSA